MKFKMEDNRLPLLEGSRILLEEKGHLLAAQGEILIKPVKWERNELAVDRHEETISIFYRDTAHFYRGLGLMLANMDKESFHLEETVQFDTNGAMLDCSRNAVLHVEGLKRYLRAMAILGMNRFMLYTEDTYQVEDYPYFGYMRGRFSREELKECDDYAALFGIEMIPCIQTLAHLKTTLRWQYADDLKDNDDILLAGSEKVREFISAMIRSASEPFRSSRIHLGMDEAYALGLGNYLKQNGYTKPFEIMDRHLDMVTQVCRELQLEPMIWSDMYFRIQSPSGEYYDIPESADFNNVLKPPAGVGMVYWDYYHTNKEFYLRYLDLHKQISDQVVFAGGGWIWNGLAPNYSLASAAGEAALAACKEKEVKDVFCTMWQDNGSETPLACSLPMLTFFAEHGFHREVSMELVKERFHSFFGGTWEGFFLFNALDNAPGASADNAGADNPSKWLFYQDLLLGLFDRQIEGLPLKQYYRELAVKISLAKEENAPYIILFEYYQVLAELLSEKCELGIELKAAYDASDKTAMRHIAADVIPVCMEYAKRVKALREKLWLAENKPFGYEVLDIRYSGVAARLESARGRIEAYLDGRIDRIEELEEVRLPYRERKPGEEHRLCSCNVWEDIISAASV